MDEPDYDAMSDEDLMERCRAARALLIDTRSPRSPNPPEHHKMAAFMEIFHPGDHRTAELVELTKAKES